MGFCIFFVDEVAVVGTYELDIVFPSKLYQFWIDFFLFFIDRLVAARLVGAVALQLDIVIVAESVFPPFHLLVGFVVHAAHYELWNFPTQTC